ncbi:hypothetical protein H3N56_02530 [Cetobacterium sp. 2A]|uniref:hypothetical protein n=1 Tax=Cetobacterium sp. 2A TaxID=2754723 RepID=UPI00163BD50D|nr:hypothetical protein [Cetobacterium sp. 2A]MBC2855369.1 hypothetical protein [Cetobacterium sp. 2A]
MGKVEKIGGRNLKIDTSFPFIKESYILKQGDYEQGTILQLEEVTGKLEKLSGDGSPHSILSEDYSNETAEIKAVVYLTGCFNNGDLVYPEGKSLADFKEKLREKTIFVR